jgi:hypothetical protein
VPALREELAVAVPADRGPGTPWKPGPPIPAAEPQPTAAPIRIGYARCSTAQQELEIQIDALERANCKRVFSEKISSRIKVRPEFEKPSPWRATSSRPPPASRSPSPPTR